MNIRAIAEMQCPYCLASFQVNHRLKTTPTSIEYGSVFCACEEFPIIAGILDLRRKYAKRSIREIQNKSREEAMKSALTQSKVWKWSPLITMIANTDSLSERQSHVILALTKVIGNAHAADYIRKRRTEKESLLLYLPLSLLPERKKEHTWLDVGSGFNSQLPILAEYRPRITFLALDISFFKLLLFRISQPSPNLSFICSDINSGFPVKPEKVSVITLIDVLANIEEQRRAIELLTKRKQLKSEGFLLITSIPEKVYLPFSETTYPLKRKLLRSFFPSPPAIMDEVKIVNTLGDPTMNLRAHQVGDQDTLFRYTVIWPRQKIRKRKYKLHIPKHAIEKAETIWQTSKVKWENRAY
ncbi:MAG: hypothetical protein A2785_02635 [Candidatus Chisholmbacteria bacterium RIFCSPHIGHO2_01_FULL_49_18]|uniref:Methyltransferase type 11 domain-containing protein n=1 Tax=Candidatus Chisholmbacteria bacterium RIFCSPHIGHO2_01_FULL_49_18 TaxID=1797590 RepID=A0A1G1VKZ6_9BACT|nr:MAG: hypothetical protein A2785_02635 [Candidatus Chisholmbacteria bacterium RIFCSPHIGHO2_01_FULL_49_18]